MAWTVFHISYEITIISDFIGFGQRAERIENVAKRVNDFDICHLVKTTDIVGFPDRAACQHRPDSIAMITDIKPVTDIQPSP